MSSWQKTFNVISIKEAIKKTKEYKKNGFKVGLCQGCFDLLHPGHIMHFEAASNSCSILIVAVSDDKTVRERKGEGRPIIPAKLSAYAISCLYCVSYVIITPHKRATPLIKLLKPDYYFKGQDYKNQRTPGIEEERKAIKSVGGIIKYTNTPKYSTGELIKHIQTKVKKKKLLIVLDRDGTIIRSVPWLGKNNNWKRQIHLNNVLLNFLYYAQKKYDVTNIVVTNQGGVARGLFTEKRVREINVHIHKLLKKNGIIISNWQYSPDADIEFTKKHPEIKFVNKYVKPITKRKPDVQMVFRALTKINKRISDYEKILVIGDSNDDEGMANNLKARYIDINKGGVKKWMKDLED